MPFFQKKGCCVFLLLSLPFLVYPQTLYFSYFDDIRLSNGAEPIEVGESDVERLIRLDLPFLLNLNDFSVLKLPEAQKDSLVKQLSERVDIDANDEETEAAGEEGAAALTEETAEAAAGEEGAAALTEEAAETVGEEGAAALTEEAAGAVGEEGAAALTEEAAEAVGEEGAAALTEEAAEAVGEEEAAALAEEAPVLNDSPSDPLFPIIGVDEASAKDAFACVVMKKAEKRILSGGQIFFEMAFDFYLAYENRKSILFSHVRTVGLGASEEEAVSQIKRNSVVSFKSVLNSLFGRAGSPYIVDFINDKKVVIAHGRNQGAFPGAFYQIVRHDTDDDGKVIEKILGRLYVEKCEEDYSFCRILYASEPVIPGDGIRKIPGVGVHQSIGYSLVISSVSVSETEVNTYFNHLIGGRWAVSRGMPLAKPIFGFEIMTGATDQLDTVGMMKAPVIGNFYVGMQVDRFFHQFSFSPFVDFGIAFTSNAMEGKDPLLWFTCKAGARFVWFFHEQVGLYLEGGYISWLGIPGKESIFEDTEYIYYAPNDYTGGFGGIGLTFLY